MTTTELGDLEALLERVLPDPRGFAERVVEQVMQRMTAQPHEPTIVTGVDGAAHQALLDRNLLLAAAVGACDCWGYDPVCAMCDGTGSPGWARPDAELYRELVEPAVRRMAAGVSETAAPHDRVTEGERE